MSDKNLAQGEEYKEPLVFGDEEKVKPINQTSSFKGKSCLKKDKDKDKPQSKFAVKINAPEPSHKNEEQPTEEIKERRKRRPQFKTVKEPTELKNRDLLNLKINKKEENAENLQKQPEGKKFIR